MRGNKLVSSAERKAVAAHTDEGRAWFGAIADELERRVRR